uniref:Sm protein E n=1 Tax=Angiostrongylus cantonensis TaxID=6313 RepID=A0A158PCC7_ANGCA
MISARKASDAQITLDKKKPNDKICPKIWRNSHFRTFSSFLAKILMDEAVPSYEETIDVDCNLFLRMLTGEHPQALGYIVGFDEYMNVVLDEAEELNMRTQSRNKLGRILLRGDNITMIHAVTV